MKDTRAFSKHWISSINYFNHRTIN